MKRNPTGHNEHLLTQQELRDRFFYDEKTGNMVWKKCDHQTRLIGKVAGCKSTGGYLQIRIRGESYSAHRLVWMYVYGRWPKHNLDHINGIRTDNRIDNLREATYSENSQNRNVNKNNTSGYPGVYWFPPTRKWAAAIRINKKKIHLGYFDTKESSIAARMQAKRAHHTFNPTDH